MYHWNNMKFFPHIPNKLLNYTLEARFDNEVSIFRRLLKLEVICHWAAIVSIAFVYLDILSAPVALFMEINQIEQKTIRYQAKIWVHCIFTFTSILATLNFYFLPYANETELKWADVFVSHILRHNSY